MYKYLSDKQFLDNLTNDKNKQKYLKVIFLTFDEKPIFEISGISQSGTLSINGESIIRRTINFTLLANESNKYFKTKESYLNKKIKVEVGYKNNINNIYDPVIWFPCGIFVISSYASNISTSGWTLSISAKDKMVLLDGSVGGTLPASVTFHERYEYDNDGNLTITTPTIFQIIQESVNHYGKEPLNNIIITDIEETAKLLIKYRGDIPIYFKDDYSSFIITSNISDYKDYIIKFVNGQDIGYMNTDFTYPGELIFNAGSSVVNLLSKICEVLGNYEFFYNIEGKFIFQEKKNYLNKSYTPIVNVNEELYIKNFSDTKYAYALYDSSTVISYTENPKFDNIKNDFIVWGQKTLSSGQSYQIRYHLAVDSKPQLNLCKQYMWKILDLQENLLKYEFTLEEKNDTIETENAILIGKPCEEWREELYRQALLNAKDSSAEGDYDQELLAEWRKLYDTMNQEWEQEWKDSGFNSKWTGWNPAVFLNPSSLSYWLDLLDNNFLLNKYSVKNIGRRSKIINNTSISSIYNKEIPDVIFLENMQEENREELISKYKAIGQKYCFIKPEQLEYFSLSSTYSSAFDFIRELLYQNLVLNTTIQISALSRYYLEPNNIIYIKNQDKGIEGNYLINQLSFNLSQSDTMNITVVEVYNRV